MLQGPLDSVSVRCFAVRLGWNETSIQLRVDAEKGPDEEEQLLEGESTVEVDGKKFPAEVKLGGTVISPVPPPTSPKTPAPSDGDVEMTDGGAPKTNGHAGDQSGSDSDGEGKGKGPARATRSGKVPTPSTKNGRMRKKRRTKKAAEFISIELGPWDVPLVIGNNILDIKAGGKDGERWRVFVDRVF